VRFIKLWHLSHHLHFNTITNNGGSGVLVLSPFIDLGGGLDTCVGNNIIQGNGNYNLYMKATNPTCPVIYARYNVWDHTDADDIMLYDIWDGNDSTGIITVDFMPFGYEGIPDYVTGSDLIIFPNPAKDKFTIQSSVFKVENATLEILDTHGRKLINRHLPEGTEEIEIDVSSLKSGVYFCRIITNKGNATKKLIIK